MERRLHEKHGTRQYKMRGHREVVSFRSLFRKNAKLDSGAWADTSTIALDAMCKTWMGHSGFEPGRRASNEDLPQLFDAGEPTAGAARDEEGEGAMAQNQQRRSDSDSQEA